jgi:SAM-dependent methyltransferase
VHPTALSYCAKFFNAYASRESGVDIVEIGSQDVNGSLRDVAPKNCRYVGLDFAEGKGVDIILKDPYSFPLEDASADIVVSSSCFEHSEFFWLTFLEGLRVLRPHGVMYINAPSNGLYHRHPSDNWRFYPDAGKALIAWSRRNGHNSSLLESFIGWQEGGLWNDFVGVFLKDRDHAAAYPTRMHPQVAGATNVYVDDGEHPTSMSPLPQDMRRVRYLVDGLNGLLRDLPKI